MTLKSRLKDWTDWDGAAFRLGLELGVFESEDDWSRNKHIFWTDNRLGKGLHDALVALTAGGVLERRDAPDDQFRWSLDGSSSAGTATV